MTTEAIEGNVEVAEENVAPELEATPPAPVEVPVTEAAEPEVAEALRLLEAVEAAPAEAAPAQPRSFADMSDDEILANERVHGLIQRQRQSAAQQAEEKLKRQMGSDEAVRQYVARLREAAEDPEAFDRAATEAINLNRRYQEDQVTEFFANGVKELYKVPPERHERAVNALASGDRAGYVTNLIDGAVEAKAATLRLADIPDGSPLRVEMEAEIKARAARVIAAELKAKQIAAAPKIEAPPAMPAGVPVGSMTNPINTMLDADRAYSSGLIDHNQYKQFREQFGLGATPGGR